MTASTLQLRPFGRSGIDVSSIGLGCNNFGGRLDLDGTRAVVDSALDDGVTFFDTADIYGGGGTSEEYLGEVLRGRRERVVLATKFGMDMGDGRGRARLPRVHPRGRSRLAAPAGTDVIDVYWYHRPDGETPILETLQALDELVRAGKVRAIGASNFNAEQIEEADALSRQHGLVPFYGVQNEYSLLVRDAEPDVLPACERLGIGFVPYFPLASGLLTGKYRRGDPAPAGTRLRTRAGRHRRPVRSGRGARALRAGARTGTRRRRDRRAARPARRLLGHRRGDEGRAGPLKRRRGPVVADRRRPERARCRAEVNERGAALTGTLSRSRHANEGWARMGIRALSAVVLTSALLVAGCGGSSSSSSPSSSSSSAASSSSSSSAGAPAFASDDNCLALAGVGEKFAQASEAAVSGKTFNLQQAQADYAQLANDARAAIQPDVKEIATAFTAFATALEKVNYKMERSRVRASSSASSGPSRCSTPAT